jgi:hypothetical protein
VSTILKALKKLEQERDALQPSGPLPAFKKAVTGAAGAGQRWRQASGLKKWGFGLGVLFISLALLYLYTSSRNGPALRTRLPAATHKPLPLATARPESGVLRPVPPPAERPLIATRRAATPEPAAPGADNPPAPPPTMDFRSPPALPTRQPAAAPAEGVEKSQPPESRPAPGRPERSTEISRQKPPLPAAAQQRSLTPGPVDAATSLQPAPPESSGTASAGNAPALSQKRSADSYDNSPVLSDGRLKVHAIAWSATVEDRMAVVNARVVHEGDSVDGFAVVAIRPEDVVVREKEKGLYRVVFGHP